ncbi:MAG: ABC transporter ATP-binding protein [Nitrospinaceae bacterium]|jgi:heme exporter protein A|nr:ABC transporter ATP-binding protein [Nitrospina sp.]MBT5377198.1 ABC transporter ATP-binding protein [Nitrospinaceae bacterium]MBT5867500.1 ABC transporter ATP-binding protein [Nitrospinaceae bacterium]MBT6346796.1 ABC transporter ATP-binding protein [Nitrospina sp.]
MADNPQPSDSVIKVHQLRKEFGVLKAVDGISFELKRGEFLSVFGPNGAGKTTLIKILAGLTRASSGTAIVAGYEVGEGRAEMRSEIGVISHSTALYGDLTPLENLIFLGKMYGLENPKDSALAVLEDVGLAPRRHDRVRTFSRGMLQRLSIARAILHDPSILFLDEPFTGLDIHASNVLKEHLQTLHNKKRTILMTTHDVSCGLEMCDKVALQVMGRFAFFEDVKTVEKENFEALYFDAVRNNQFTMGIRQHDTRLKT